MGGAERALLDLLRAVSQARPDWKLELIAAADGELVAATQEIGITVRVLPFPRSVKRLGDAGAGGPAGSLVSRRALFARLALSAPKLAAYLYRLRSLLSRCQVDLVHSNGFKTHIIAAWAAPRHVRVIWHMHDYVQSRPVISKLLRIHAARCSVAIANSHSVARDLEPVCRGRLDTRVVYNAVDLKRFSPEGPCLDLDALAGLPPAPAGTVRVGLVATMARWKGHQVFLQALSMLTDCRIRGYVIGGPIYETAGSQCTLDELRTKARDYGLDGHVGFTDYVKDSAAAIRALDVVVHASTQPEPFGLVVAEAMSCGKPIIASRAGGINEIITENETALGHGPSNAKELASRIALLTSDLGLRAKLALRGRQWAEKHFDPSRLAGEVVPIYNSIAN
jgi:glycosyltransferase involved in cell wall biosynthesis